MIINDFEALETWVSDCLGKNFDITCYNSSYEELVGNAASNFRFYFKQQGWKYGEPLPHINDDDFWDIVNDSDEEKI